MDAWQFGEPTQQLINDFLVWVGYGTIVGLTAKAIMPGRDPGGPIATLGMGISGVIIGCGVWSFATEGQRVIPISPIGMIVGTAGALLILFFYRLLAGYWFEEPVVGAAPPRRRRRRTRSRRRYRLAEQYDDY